MNKGDRGYPEVLVTPSEAWLTFSRQPAYAQPAAVVHPRISSMKPTIPSLGPAAVNEDTPEREGA